MKYLLDKEETERLRFRLIDALDFDMCTELFAEPETGGFIGMGHIPGARGQCEEWFRRMKNRYDNDLGGMNILIEKSTNEFVGQCGLLIQEIDGMTELEVGYLILSRFRNKGYATEAARKCIDFAFEHNYTESLISIIHTENIKSARVAVKNGMAVSQTTIFQDMPVNIYRISRADWYSLR